MGAAEANVPGKEVGGVGQMVVEEASEVGVFEEVVRMGLVEDAARHAMSAGEDDAQPPVGRDVDEGGTRQFARVKRPHRSRHKGPAQ